MDFIILFPWVLVALFGLMFGSYCNVCILRIPMGESVVTEPSHCPVCNKRLRWWELFPVFSYLALRGKCSGCHTRISPQYPIIEAANAVLWLLAFSVTGISLDLPLYCGVLSTLLVLSIIDMRTREIPLQTTIFIGVLAAIRFFLNLDMWQTNLLGLLIIPGILLLLLIFSGGAAIGGGDVKLMAGAGLFLGFPLTLLAFILGCGIGSVVHLVRMRFFSAGRDLAMGPYLAVGIAISMLWGDGILQWYLSFLQ